MPKYTQKAASGPTSIRSLAYFTVTGTAYATTALSDGLDTTYCKVSSATSPVDMVTLWAFPAAGERIVSVCPYVRSKQPGTKVPHFAVSYGWWDGSMYGMVEGIAMNLPAGVSAITGYEIAPHLGQLLVPRDSSEWKWVQNTYPTVSVYDPHTSDANRVVWYEMGLYFYTLKPATVAAPTAPAGTVSTTQYPTCTAVVSSVVESWQNPANLPPFLAGVTIEWSVYAGTYTTPPAGQPVARWTQLVTINNYIDGVTASTTAANATPPVPLPNGAMTLFCRASRDHPSGVPAWSAYAYKQWTQACPNPANPTLTLTKDDAGQAVTIQANCPTTAGYDSATGQIEVARQVGAAWRAVRNVSGNAVAIGSLQTLGKDYEGDRDITNTYRVRVSMWHTVDQVRRYSDWVTATVSGPATTGTGWNLKAVELPAATWLSAPVATAPQESGQRSTSVLEPLDRDRPVVLSGTPAGRGGTIELTANGTTDVAALEALEDYTGVVYMETAFGDAKHVRLTRGQWTRLGTKASPRRTASFEFTEVNSGLAVVSS